MLTNGIVIPNFTVFDANEDVDFDATSNHIDWLIQNGADAIVPCGSSGEWPALHHNEAELLILTAISTTAKRVPVYPSTGRYSTRETIELSQYAERSGANGVMICPPPIMLPSEQAVVE